MDYIELIVKYQTSSEVEISEVIVAKLGEIGYESFTEEENTIKAYIQSNDFSFENASITLSNIENTTVELSFSNIEKQNWNAVWESNFKPVYIGKNCLIRAPFHNDLPKVDYEIVIEPKMSFGTGHHETTSLMAEYVLANDFSNLTVLDMGCGTGILAILASMKNASEVTAIDYDEWSYENTVENLERNNITNGIVMQGDFDVIQDLCFDVILANINRNILSQHAQDFYNSTNSNGFIYLSGFYNKDLDYIKEIYEKVGFTFVDNIEKNNWNAAKFKKN
ncbi:MAG TPA: 50S ribosomal protein L11 methyltransferase [Bacteroidales bacterium]|nr:MAG: ribosomal protein L11 methyltransferase [Bacteroidetes bacterium GWF2_33_38]OFY73770.1 MAG: ribosomal protein L11 methyltransferase [Bacteroidetes bacterium RIFOXYA12_FULL_33_9]OFY89848.1 MAG: ribosomal protein L11 methyltransferase [Bacteroidetes bacterium RIFOXYA2_FULL_33_7]HBF88792.1 50S ribosomal protein L11 methyltransferase [Bacteroidales bacterium]